MKFLNWPYIREKRLGTRLTLNESDIWGISFPDTVKGEIGFMLAFLCTHLASHPEYTYEQLMAYFAEASEAMLSVMEKGERNAV